MATKKASTISQKEEDKVEIVKKVVGELLELMGLNFKADVYKDSENEAIRVDIDAKEEAGILIGNRGKTLQSIQSLVGIILKRRTSSWTRVILNVSDWREKEESRLNKLALQVAERVKETGRPQQLYNLTSSQRRIIHLALSSDPDVVTESVGEGRDRYLIVSPKKTR